MFPPAIALRRIIGDSSELHIFVSSVKNVERGIEVNPFAANIDISRWLFYGLIGPSLHYHWRIWVVLVELCEVRDNCIQIGNSKDGMLGAFLPS